MTAYLLILISALLLAVAATPVAKRAAYRFGVIDKPSARKVHSVPTPLLGGAAIFAAVILALVILGDRFYASQVAGILLGATLMSFMGLWDDRRGLSPWIKLAGQCGAAAILTVTDVRIGLFPWLPLNYAATILWVVGITNAMNLLDNMDGLSGGIAAIAALFFLLFAAMSHQYLVGALAAALVGACIGFLFYNLNPASIFMGDTGSLFLGFTLAAVGIKLRFPANSAFVTWMVPPLVLAVPIFDTSLVIISRLRRGLNPLTTPGRDHLSHRLARLTGSRREAVLLCYLFAFIAGVVATFVTQASMPEGYAVGVVMLAAGAYGIWRMEKLFRGWQAADASAAHAASHSDTTT
ncbi:MAG: putative undecaprenyl-phosphate N-acetylglucosaminyl 1-phosphate transferase [Chloroflexi bacterium ADurb.Bin325]|nr:MAG: putative undecaprenyl-phosphate N-acetylglucosaminyl 1-phosphate transferase [Chloroflexi bacterium ADurb.Bin325]